MQALRAQTLLDAHPRQRTDLLRRALRGAEVEETIVSAELDEWLRLYRNDPQPGLRALILVLVQDLEGEAVDEMLRRGRRDRGDGVRLEAYRILLSRDPSQSLVAEALDDSSVELRLLGAHYLRLADPISAIDAVIATCMEETEGPRGEHALRRCSEVLAEEFADPRALPALRELAATIDDPEGHLEWAIETLEETDPSHSPEGSP